MCFITCCVYQYDVTGRYMFLLAFYKFYSDTAHNTQSSFIVPRSDPRLVDLEQLWVLHIKSNGKQLYDSGK